MRSSEPLAVSGSWSAKVTRFGHLERREMVLAIRSQVGHLQVRASGAHDDCTDTFAVQRVRDAEHRDLVDPGIGHEDVFDMFG